MYQRLKIVVLAATVLAVGSVASAEELKTADEVIDRYVAAIGGREKLEAVRTARFTLKLMGHGGQVMPLTVETVLPDKLRADTVFQGLTSVQACNGDTGWAIMPFGGNTDAQRLPADRVEMLREEMDFLGPMVDYQAKGHTVELLGKEDLEGTEVYKLRITKKSGSVETNYIDADYFLPIKLEGKSQMMGSPMEYSLTFSDYKKVEGLMFAHSIQTTGPMGGATMTVEKIDLNVEIDPDRFIMPEPTKEKPDPSATQPASDPDEPDSDD